MPEDINGVPLVTGVPVVGETLSGRKVRGSWLDIEDVRDGVAWHIVVGGAGTDSNALWPHKHLRDVEVDASHPLGAAYLRSLDEDRAVRRIAACVGVPGDAPPDQIVDVVSEVHLTFRRLRAEVDSLGERLAVLIGASPHASFDEPIRRAGGLTELLVAARRAANKLRASRLRGEGGTALYREEFDTLISVFQEDR